MEDDSRTSRRPELEGREKRRSGVVRQNREDVLMDVQPEVRRSRCSEAKKHIFPASGSPSLKCLRLQSRLGKIDPVAAGHHSAASAEENAQVSRNGQQTVLTVHSSA